MAFSCFLWVRTAGFRKGVCSLEPGDEEKHQAFKDAKGLG